VHSFVAWSCSLPFLRWVFSFLSRPSLRCNIRRRSDKSEGNDYDMDIVCYFCNFCIINRLRFAPIQHVNFVTLGTSMFYYIIHFATSFYTFLTIRITLNPLKCHAFRSFCCRSILSSYTESLVEILNFFFFLSSLLKFSVFWFIRNKIIRNYYLLEITRILEQTSKLFFHVWWNFWEYIWNWWLPTLSTIFQFER